jgi:hypothetical protein
MKTQNIDLHFLFDCQFVELFLEVFEPAFSGMGIEKYETTCQEHPRVKV